MTPTQRLKSEWRHGVLPAPRALWLTITALATACGVAPTQRSTPTEGPPPVVETAAPDTSGGACLQLDDDPFAIDAYARVVTVEGMSLTVCREGAAGIACHAISLEDGSVRVSPTIKGTPEPTPFGRPTNASKTRRVKAVERDGGGVEITVYDAVSDKALGTFDALADKNFECATAGYLGDRLVVLQDVCAGPAGAAWLPDAKGKVRGWIGGREGWGAYNLQAVHLDGDRWAFREENGTEVVVQDLSTAEVVARHSLVSALPRDPDGHPITDPSSGWLLKTGDGRLVVVNDWRRFFVVDPVTGKVDKVVRPRRCR